MRNLKRALSLTLASVMLLGMMVVGAGAAGFPDVADDNDNVEAIEVLQAIEVMVGNADTGNFEPDRSVTRTEMAVVMANLLKLDYKYYEASCDFWDVPTWARPYVGACYANKIVSGYGDGTYGALDPITPVQAASMMMRALGYFQYSEDYKDGFETATVRQGTQIGIFEGIGSSADKDMTRGQVARMALNALESEMVTFTGTPGTTYTTSTGESITVGYVAKYEPRTSTELKYKAIEDRTSDASLDSNHRGQYYIQLGEELYDGKLVKSYDRDVFMRPSINWQYKGAEIGTYVDYELKKAEYLTGVKYSKLYGDLTYTTINNNDIDRYVDGALQADETKDNFYRANDETVKGTGTGALTEVFLDERNDLITITTINTYLAQANSDYNKTSESLSLKVFDKRGGTTKVVDADVVPQVVNVQKDDYKLVYMSFKDRANGEVVSMYDVEIMAEAEISKFSIDGSGTYDKVVKKLTTGGTEYDTNVKAYYDGGNVLDEYNSQLLSDMSYNIYMDRYDNVIGVDLHEGAKNYVFITGYDRGISHISTKTADAAAIFTDGTMDVITVNVTDTNKNIDGLRTGSESKSYDQYDVWSGDGKIAENRWYTYTVNASGTYTLRPVKNFMFSAFDDAGITYGDTIRTLNTANLFLKDGAPSSVSYDNKGNIYGNDDSIYLTVEAGRVDKSDKVDGTGATPETNPLPGSDDKVNDAIVDIVGRYTGAQDVKIDLKADVKQEVNEIKTTAEKDAYVYSIFDNNYYVIASVVLGEAQGAAANYVYVLDGVQNERVEHGKDAKSASDDTYYWEFKAVVDGEETTLTVKEKYDNTLNSLKNILKVHTIQEIRFDGEYVTAIKDVALKDTFTNPSSEQTLEDMKIYDIGNEYGQTWTVNNADGNGFVHNNNYGRPNTALDTSDPNAGLYNGVRVEGNRIEVVGRTLYTNRDRGDVGLALANNAKAVVVQPVNGSIKVTNCGSVSEAVGMLADRYPGTSNKEFKGRVAAALDSAGAAKWVVIISDTNLVTGDRPNYDYDGKTYTLTLRDCLSNWNVTNYDRAHVFMRANNSSNWEPVDAKGTGVYSDVYEILSGYQVRVTDRDIDANGKIAGSLANSAETPISISEYISRNEIQFVMPSANVELKENIAYTYTITSFEIKLNQPIKEGALDLTKIEIIPHATKVAKAADPEIPGLVLKAKTAVGEITNGKLVATVTWDAPADGFNTYEVASTYTATVSDDKGNVQTTEDLPNTSLSAQADTTVLAGPVVVVATTDENGKVTAFNVTDLNKAEADGFLVVNGEDEKLGEGTVATEGDKTTITAELGENATEGDTITINGDEVTVGKDGQVSTETEPVDPAEAIKAVVMTAVPADEVAAEADLTATTSTAGVTVAVAPAKAPAEAGEFEVVITVSTENEKGFAVDVAVTGAEGWAVSAVTEGAKSFTLTKTITVTADPEKPSDDPMAARLDTEDETGKTIIVPYNGTKPTTTAIAEKIKADLKMDLVVTGNPESDATLSGLVRTDATQQYTIKLEKRNKVVIGSAEPLYLVDGTNVKVDAEAGSTAKFYIPGGADVAAAAQSGQLEVVEGKITITTLNADVTLVPAVKVTVGDGLTHGNDVKWFDSIVDTDTGSAAGWTAFAAADMYVKDGTKLKISATGTANVLNRITANGTAITEEDVAGAETVAVDSYTVSLANAQEGVITLKMESGLKVVVVGTTATGMMATDGTSITIDAIDALKTGTYVQAGTAYTAKVNIGFEGMDTTKMVISGIVNNVADAKKDGVIYLVPAVEVAGTNAGGLAATFALKFSVGEGDDAVSFDKTDVAKAATLYLPVGAELNLATTGLKSTEGNDGKYIAYKLGTSEETTKLADVSNEKKNLVVYDAEEANQKEAEGKITLTAGEKVTFLVHDKDVEETP